MENCIKCGEPFTPTLIKPMSICNNCKEILGNEIDEYAKNEKNKKETKTENETETDRIVKERSKGFDDFINNINKEVIKESTKLNIDYSFYVKMGVVVLVNIAGRTKREAKAQLQNLIENEFDKMDMIELYDMNIKKVKIALLNVPYENFDK